MAETKKKRPTALKRELQNERRHLRSRAFKSRVRTAMRHFEASLSAGDKEKINEYKNLVYSLMDKGTKKGIYKLNKASRVKSRITQKCSAALA